MSKQKQTLIDFAYGGVERIIFPIIDDIATGCDQAKQAADYLKNSLLAAQRDFLEFEGVVSAEPKNQGEENKNENGSDTDGSES